MATTHSGSILAAIADVAAHVHAGSSLLQGAVRHGEGIEHWKLRAARHDDRHRAGGRHCFEVLLAVVGDARVSPFPLTCRERSSNGQPAFHDRTERALPCERVVQDNDPHNTPESLSQPGCLLG